MNRYTPYNATCRIHKATGDREFHELVRISKIREKCRICGVVVATSETIGRCVEKMIVVEWP